MKRDDYSKDYDKTLAEAPIEGLVEYEDGF
jgi:hypothetical protein